MNDPGDEERPSSPRDKAILSRAALHSRPLPSDLSPSVQRPPQRQVDGQRRRPVSRHSGGGGGKPTATAAHAQLVAPSARRNGHFCPPAAGLPKRQPAAGPGSRPEPIDVVTLGSCGFRATGGNLQRSRWIDATQRLEGAQLHHRGAAPLSATLIRGAPSTWNGKRYSLLPRPPGSHHRGAAACHARARVADPVPRR